MAEASGNSTVRRIVGPTILLAGGTYFDFLDPAGSEFSIEDIAHGLSHVCRFAGHCAEFYSVAQHSVLLSWQVPAEDAFAGLMHDAAEAFVGDVAKPLKELLPEYQVIEKSVEAAIADRFGFSLPLPATIKEADIRMLATEQRAMMRNSDEWHHCHGREPYPIEIVPWPPQLAKAAFLNRFAELTAETREA